MRVTKRNGKHEDIKFDKVTKRISNLSDGLSDTVDCSRVAHQVASQMYDGIHSHEIDTLSAEVCVGLITEHPDYEVLATRIVASNLQKICPGTFLAAMRKLRAAGVVTDEVVDVAAQVKDAIVPERDFDFGYFGLKTLEKGYLQRVDGNIIETPQYLFMRVAIGIHGTDLPSVHETYFHLSNGLFTHATPTLFNAGTPRPQMSSCFLIANKGDSIDGIYGTITEAAQISKWAGGIGVHISDVRAKGSHIKGTNGTSDGIIPMLRVYNATARYVNQAGKRKGSIAVYLEPWHADVMDFLELRLNQGDEEARCRDLFLALWIPDLFMQRVEEGGNWSLMCPSECPGLNDVYGEEFNELYLKYESEGRAKKTIPAVDVWKCIIKSQVETGNPYMLYKDSINRKNGQKNLGVIKSSNLCVAPETKILTRDGYQTISELKDRDVDVWNGKEWSPVVVRQTGVDQKLLTVTTSLGFSLRCTPYHKFYLEDGSVVEARELKPGAQLISHAMPDGSVRTQDVGSIVDLGDSADTFCFTEHKRHMGVFNGILTSQCSEIVEYTDPDETAVCNLASIALPKYVRDGKFDYRRLHNVTKMVTKNLNRVIDRNFYPTESARRSNMRHRPIGIGVQGLADTFLLCDLAFDSEEARTMNAHIFETIYNGALEASHELALVDGSYESFEGSPASQGILQFDMWPTPAKFSGRYDWDQLKEKIKAGGLRNSLLLAPMPTASTAQILGNNEAFEPYTSHIYLRRTLAGEFVIVNKHLVKELQAMNLWNPHTKDIIVRAGGSIQNIKELPDDMKNKYKTVWELSQKVIIDMAADRGHFVDQSQSMNLFVESPTIGKLSSMHMYAWKSSLKTGMYYLRSKAKARPIQFSLEPECEACGA